MRHSWPTLRVEPDRPHHIAQDPPAGQRVRPHPVTQDPPASQRVSSATG